MSWGSITGDIEDQSDLVDYISENGGGGGSSKIPDWEEGSYNKDQTVIVYEGDNAALYRSLVDDNDSNPLLTNPWEYVGEVGDILNWDSETNYNLGGRVLYLLEGGEETQVVLFESAIDSPSSNPLEGLQTGEWIIKAILADPVGWDVNTEYSPYGGVYPTVVSYGSSYYSTLVSVIGVDPLSTNPWEKVSNLEFDEKNFRTVNGKVYLGESDESDNIFLSSTDESSSIKLSRGSGSSSFEKKYVGSYSGNTYSEDSAMIMSGGLNGDLSLSNSVTFSGEPLPAADSKLNLSATRVNGESHAFLLTSSRDGSGDLRQSALELYSTNNNNRINLRVIVDNKVAGLSILSNPYSNNTFTDQINEFGLGYSSDYSANGSQHDRWIPDYGAVKAYVDNAVSNITPNLTFENGLHEEDGVVKLGLDMTDPSGTTGVLTKDTYLLRGTPLHGSAISIGQSALELRVSSELGAQAISIGIDESSPIFITDSKNEIGLQYIGDYSANGKLSDRWIPDYGAVKAYVDSVAGGGSWGSITGDIEDQSDLVDYIAEGGAFNVVDVTQQAYTDKAINVKAFNNTGMSYSEGSIDFGITRDEIHTMGLYAFKQGFETTASGLASAAFGQYATASDDMSTAFGYGTTASGNASTAFGDSTEASGDFSSAFGLNTRASGSNSTAFGNAATANEYASIAIGRFSTDGAVETSWTTGSPIFKVGNGTAANSRSNAYVLNNDGTSTQYGIASYGADYSANFTDRSLVDKGYTDALVNSRLSAAQRLAIDALVSPTVDYADMTEATAAIKSIIDALKAV